MMDNSLKIIKLPCSVKDKDRNLHQESTLYRMSVLGGNSLFYPLSCSSSLPARKMSFRNDKGESFSFDHDLEPTSCNIYFIPEGDSVEHQIVHHGRLRPSPVCSGFYLLGSCGVTNNNPKESCSGQYEVRDSMGNEVLVVTVEVEGCK